MILDYLQATCWSITYILLIIYASKTKMCGIPIIPLALNYAWETVALTITLFINLNIVSLLMHGAWFFLDTIILILFLLQKTAPRKNKIFFLLFYMLAILCFTIVYNKQDLVIFAYYIDFIMAVEFVFFSLFCDIKKGWISYGIAVFKLLGDLFAWLNLFDIHWSTIVVLLLNASYLFIILCKKTDDALFHQKKSSSSPCNSPWSA